MFARAPSAVTRSCCSPLALIGLSIVLIGLSPDGTGSLRHAPVWLPVAVLVAFAVAEHAVFYLEHRREAIAFSLSEVPSVFALVFLDIRVAVAVRVVGSLAAKFVTHRPPPFKMLFNAGVFAFEAAAAAVPAPPSAGRHGRHRHLAAHLGGVLRVRHDGDGCAGRAGRHRHLRGRVHAPRARRVAVVDDDLRVECSHCRPDRGAGAGGAGALVPGARADRGGVDHRSRPRRDHPDLARRRGGARLRRSNRRRARPRCDHPRRRRRDDAAPSSEAGRPGGLRRAACAAVVFRRRAARWAPEPRRRPPVASGARWRDRLRHRQRRRRRRLRSASCSASTVSSASSW